MILQIGCLSLFQDIYLKDQWRLKRFIKHCNFTKVGYAVLIISLFIFVLSLYFYLLGPDERIISLNATVNYKGLLTPNGNKTIYLSPFQRRGLIEYDIYNLSEFLINRTINIQLKTENGGKVDLYLMNYTQLECWQNGSLPYGDISKEKIEDTQLTFFPKSVWKAYFLVLLNTEDINVNVDVKVFQQFFIKKLDYDKAFSWLKIAFLSAIPLFALQIPLKATPDDIVDRIRKKILKKILPVTYRKYVAEKGRPLPILFIAATIVGIMCLIFSIVTPLEVYEASSLVNQIWEDYFYRFVILTFLLYVIFSLIVSFSMILFNLFEWSLIPKYYPSLEIYEKSTEIHLQFMKKLLIKHYSIIFYLCLSVLFILVLQAGASFILSMSTSFLFAAYIGYIVSLAYFKTQKIVPTEPFNDFKYAKACLGSTAISSIILVYSIQTILPLLDLTSKYILDQNILISHSSVPGILTSNGLAEFFNYITPFFTYIIPLSMLTVYYSMVFFSVVYLPRRKEFKTIHLPKSILTDSELELAFFLTVFALSLWIQSFFITTNLQRILISLLSSFIASSFRSYLEAVFSAPEQCH